MLGDVLLLNDSHLSAAESIHAKVKESLDNCGVECKYIVAISGESGAGKSEVSHYLAKLIKKSGFRVKLLHTDNYYNIGPILRPEWRATFGLESIGINEYNWDLLNQNIQDFKNNRIAAMPCIDIVSDQVDELFTDFAKIHVLVIDGLYAINIEEANLKVFIELTYLETKMSQIMRGKEPQDEYRMAVLEREHQAVQALKPQADLLIDKNYQVVEAK